MSANAKIVNALQLDNSIRERHRRTLCYENKIISDLTDFYFVFFQNLRDLIETYPTTEQEEIVEQVPEEDEVSINSSEEKMSRNEEETENFKRPISRRHSFSFLPKLRENKPVRSPSPSDKQIRKVPKLIVGDPKLEEYALAKSPETSLAESLLQLVRSYPGFVREISDFVFEKQIGQGGFGEVWLANDLVTGKVCAVKELYADKLVGKCLANFVREIITMAKTRNRFCIPFIGFTIEKPYSIITEYMPNGSLETILKQERALKISLLSGTHLTLIAIGTIHALRHIHSIHILHRDVKAPNILLDKRQLPKLCDFGISRIEARDAAMTNGIGTASHMAPEILNSPRYDSKVDIFAFGMTLYEMIEKHRPFNTLNMFDTVKKIKHNIRPGFRKQDIPKPLIDLIKACWNADPEKRPTASSIYQMFAKGEVAFAGTDPEVVKEFCATLRMEQKARKKDKRPRRLMIVADVEAIEARLASWADACRREDEIRKACMLPLRDDLSRSRGNMIVLTPEERQEKLMRQRDKEAHESQILPVETPQMIDVNGTLNVVLKNPDDPRFREVAASCVGALGEESMLGFASAMLNALLHHEDPTLPEFIVDTCTAAVCVNKGFIDVLTRAHFFSALPTETQPQLEASLQLVGQVFMMAPNKVNSSMFRPLARIVAALPTESVGLFTVYASHYTKIRNTSAVVNFMFSVARVFLNTEGEIGEEYIRALHCMMEAPKFNEHIDKARGILSAFACSPATNVARAAIRAITHHYDPLFVVPFNALLKLLQEPGAADDVASLLLRVDTLPVSRTLYKAVNDRSVRSVKMLKVVLKYAGQQPETAMMCASHPRWLLSASPYALRVFLLIFAMPAARARIVQYRGFSEFLTRQVRANPHEALVVLGPVMRRVGMSQTLIDRMTHAGFVAALADAFKRSESADELAGAMFALDAMARGGYSSDFRMFFEPLAALLNPPTKLTKQAVVVLTTLSSHKKIAEKFKKAGLERYFRQIVGNEALGKHARVFLANVDCV